MGLTFCFGVSGRSIIPMGGGLLSRLYESWAEVGVLDGPEEERRRL